MSMCSYVIVNCFSWLADGYITRRQRLGSSEGGGGGEEEEGGGGRGGGGERIRHTLYVHKTEHMP